MLRFCSGGVKFGSFVGSITMSTQPGGRSYITVVQSPISFFATFGDSGHVRWGKWWCPQI